MTKSNSSVTLSTSILYEHPWCAQLQLLESTTTCESPSPPKRKSDRPGRKYTSCIHCTGETKPPSWDHRIESWTQYRVCAACDQFWTKHRFRLTPEDRVTLNSNPFCQICGSTDDLNIDHCHTTNKVRGYLCGAHNKGIGLFKDNIEHLTAAIDYLKLHGN